MYFDCRRAGITLRSSIDCTIAQIAVEHGAALLHNDRDFERIGRVVPRLRFA
jgi:predicted nucleic acid-binding protein